MSTFSEERHRVAMMSVASNRDVGGNTGLKQLYTGAKAAFHEAVFEAVDVQLSRVLTSTQEIIATALNTRSGVYVQLRGKPTDKDLLLSIGRKYCIEGVDASRHQASTFIFGA